MKPNRRERDNKIGLTVMALLLIFYGTLAMIENRWTYGNYWGGQVFAPVFGDNFRSIVRCTRKARMSSLLS